MTSEKKDNWKSTLVGKRNNFNKNWDYNKLRSINSKQFKNNIIWKNLFDKKTYFLTLKNYYTDELELKRIKENKGNRKYD